MVETEPGITLVIAGITLYTIEYIDLSSNNLLGTITQELVMGCLSLYFLKLSDNKLRGQIFPKSVDLPDLTLLYLDSNEFSSSIPKSLSTIPLALLDSSNNFLSDRIPTSMGNMTTLFQLSLSTIQFEGPIPKEICNLNDLSLLDLSKNKLCGSVPSCFNPSSIRHIYLNDNQLEGELTYAFSNSSSLLLLDLGWNKFIGRIPQWIGNLSSLSIILLRCNHFEGTIPNEFCEMNKLSMIHLSSNFLLGQIPHCFGNITLEVAMGKFSTNNGVMDTSPSQTFTSYVDKIQLERDYHIPL
ncbi:Hypothetical predicted protein [Olea europaea subsp. europaea]|uniref:Uncharacterized protein n=1 Tax=Olea europaea subsp. europaea TaxID=158383 RepID=A0A8S0VFM0_OLEEU|nr:Hypothetical predicted protein [Olea europaea subsp. europaea]